MCSYDRVSTTICLPAMLMFAMSAASVVAADADDATGMAIHGQHAASATEGGAVDAKETHDDTLSPGGAQTVPTLAGQYAFATIAEIIMLLEQDPETDWATVDLERLREHLIDMNRVTLGASVTTVEVAGGARFSVTGAESTVENSIRRMTRAHAATANHPVENDGDVLHGWDYVLDSLPDGVALTVTGPDERAAKRIRAYGFIGVMVAGAHHPRHHLALARGSRLHAH